MRSLTAIWGSILSACKCVCASECTFIYFSLFVNTLAPHVHCKFRAVKAFSWWEKSLCKSQPDAAAFSVPLYSLLPLLSSPFTSFQLSLLPFLHVLFIVLSFCFSLAAAHSTSCFAFAFSSPTGSVSISLSNANSISTLFPLLPFLSLICAQAQHCATCCIFHTLVLCIF